jgi:hypothetical protein
MSRLVTVKRAWTKEIHAGGAEHPSFAEMVERPFPNCNAGPLSFVSSLSSPEQASVQAGPRLRPTCDGTLGEGARPHCSVAV